MFIATRNFNSKSKLNRSEIFEESTIVDISLLLSLEP